jgi:hypothetical protein
VLEVRHVKVFISLPCGLIGAVKPNTLDPEVYLSHLLQRIAALPISRVRSYAFTDMR